MNKASTIAIVTSIVSVMGIVAASPAAQGFVSNSLASHPTIAVIVVGLVKILLTLFNPSKSA